MYISYFSDSRFIIENHLESYDFSTRVFSLVSQNLTTVYHPELLSMVVKVDFSNNNLTSVKGFNCFVCVRELTLDGNKISDIEELSYLSNLTQLSMKKNCILFSCIIHL